MCFKMQFIHVILCAQENVLSLETMIYFFRNLWWIQEFKQQLFELNVFNNNVKYQFHMLLNKSNIFFQTFEQ